MSDGRNHVEMKDATLHERWDAMRADVKALEAAVGPGGVRLRAVDGGVAAPQGFQAAGVHAGIKRRRRDVGLVVSDRPAAAAGTYTTNRVRAAPVDVTRAHVERGPLRAIVCNSGNANACTGAQGERDAWAMAAETAGMFNIEPHEVAVASTGVIGVPLPMDKIVPAIREAAGSLSRSGGADAAEAIMTTDTVPKEIAVTMEIGGRQVTIGGMAKGSGMIHPNMATMLAFLTTDAPVEPDVLQRWVSAAVDRTFNVVTVDGDTSTNDMVVCLANGAVGGSAFAEGSPEGEAIAWALESVMAYLARCIARDGEGATCLVEVRVTGAPDEATARRVARSVSSSNLVKTAVHGRDPNWGRVFCAVGYSGVDLDPDRLDVMIGDIPVAVGGQGVAFDEAKAVEALSGPNVVITVNMNSGSASAAAWTCDLSAEYVKINADYRT